MEMLSHGKNIRHPAYINLNRGKMHYGLMRPEQDIWGIILIIKTVYKFLSRTLQRSDGSITLWGCFSLAGTGALDNIEIFF